ncbi:MAG: hypothetical protein WC280_01390 [Patescibacteria group bacterium]
MPSFEDFSKRKEEEPWIKSLDELSETMKNVLSEWLKITNIDEHGLRLREVEILKALQTLKITEEWKVQNVDLAVNLIQVADTKTLIDEIKKMFFLNSVPESTISARQILNKIKFIQNREN